MQDKVLVIDDAPDIHALIKARLGKENLSVLSAFDGTSGIDLARREDPDLILLDVDMPERDGFQICTELKGDSALMHIPIIFLTGAASTEQKIRGLELGAVDYITKPFDAAELRARVRASLRIKALVDLLARKAMVDGLTGLWNRAYLDTRMNTELAASRRSGRPLACIMADVDRFKQINDKYGHAFGDDVLRAVAVQLTLNCREEDVVCRYGGEEFAILLPDTPVTKAAEIAERLRLAIEATEFPHRSGPVRVTSSFGVADLRQNVPPTVLEIADQALYRAKSAGRNRVEVADTAVTAVA